MRGWKWLAVAIVLVGAIYTGFAYWGIGRLSTHSIWYLHKFYEHREVDRDSYRDLLLYAEQITRDRNQISLLAHMGVGIFVVFLGGAVFLFETQRMRHANGTDGNHSD